MYIGEICEVQGIRGVIARNVQGCLADETPAPHVGRLSEVQGYLAYKQHPLPRILQVLWWS